MTALFFEFGRFKVTFPRCTSRVSTLWKWSSFLTEVLSQNFSDAWVLIVSFKLGTAQINYDKIDDAEFRQYKVKLFQVEKKNLDDERWGLRWVIRRLGKAQDISRVG